MPEPDVLISQGIRLRARARPALELLKIMPELHVFVFGAGASKGWSLDPFEAPPLTRDFFISARESIRLRSDGFAQRWPCFAELKTIYGLPRRLTPLRLLQEGHFDELNLEDAATRLFRRSVMASSGRRAFFNFKSLIAVTIGKALERLHRRWCRFHDNVVAHHIRSQDTIVSFNYDWILERSLERHWRDWGRPEDYCFPGALGNWQSRKRPRLLKPHGSLDWQLDGSSVVLGDRGKILGAIHGRKFKPESIAIVPPVLSKELEAKSQAAYVRTHFDELWQRTADTFSRARRIVFIGYSLPRGDTRAYQTVLGAANRRNCRVEIVNPDGARLRDELSIVFGRNNVKWEFTSIEAYSRARG